MIALVVVLEYCLENVGIGEFAAKSSGEKQRLKSPKKRLARQCSYPDVPWRLAMTFVA